MHRPYRIERLMMYGQETEQLIFKFETARKVEVQDLCGKKYLLIKHGLMVVDSGT